MKEGSNVACMGQQRTGECLPAAQVTVSYIPRGFLLVMGCRAAHCQLWNGAGRELHRPTGLHSTEEDIAPAFDCFTARARLLYGSFLHTKGMPGGRSCDHIPNLAILIKFHAYLPTSAVQLLSDEPYSHRILVSNGKCHDELRMSNCSLQGTHSTKHT
jgi:hypothetical protein